MLIRGILPNILSPRGPLIECPGSGGTTAVSTSPSITGMHMYRHVHNTIFTCMRIITPTITLRVFGVTFGLYWAEINKEK